jgi:hypothetical protein
MCEEIEKGKKLIKKLLREQLLNEKLTDVDNDVDLLYNMFFSDDLTKLNKTRILNYDMFGSEKTDTSILTSPLAKKAHSINPCNIITNIGGNGYIPGQFKINISINHNAINAVNNASLNKNIDLVSDYLGVPTFLQEFKPNKIKGSIHHELTHWIDDTLNNRHITKLVNKNVSRGVKLGNKGQNINADKMEIQAQIHNIYQLKKEYESQWDYLTLDSLFNLSPTLTTVNKSLTGDIKTKWRTELFHRMGREGLLGKNMR